MDGRPVRNNHNPGYENRNNNRNNTDNEDNILPPPQPRAGLSQAELRAIATIVATNIQGLGNINANGNLPPPGPPAHGVKYHYESLRKNRTQTFKGDPDPEVAQSWLKNIETQLRLLEIPNKFKVDVWFREVFLKQYYPAEVRLHKLSEFENFAQTMDMSVVEYTLKFNSIGTYAPTIMADDTLKMHRFKRGLRSRIHSALAVYQPTSFADLMGATIRAEIDIKRREDENKNKLSLTGHSGACFNCGKLEHRIADCPEPKKGTWSNTDTNTKKPKKNKPNTRVFAITQEEADDSNKVVAGTILINEMSAYV
ncbi:uncharacterized protein [Primulina huaijiensis]|uniref:uncharacterized protein n=1 Tax=Primulina huaijiensis TaxID=1492673 RepID=UPI003CC71CCA